METHKCPCGCPDPNHYPEVQKLRDRITELEIELENEKTFLHRFFPAELQSYDDS